MNRTNDDVPTTEPSQPRRVLIADDDPATLRSCSRALELAGYQIETANNGASALQIFASAKFDAVVTDITMPGMSGLEFLKTIRQTDLDVPVILMTGFPALDTAIGAVELGALRYLLKPFDMAVMVEAVDKAVRLRRLAELKREAVSLSGDDARQFGDRFGLQAAFDRALDKLWMAFQPLVSWSQQVTFAYEGLVRSEEPSLANPAALLSAAERLGRLHDLGRAVRRRVAQQIKDLPTQVVFVNLHASDLMDDELYSASAPLSEHASRVVYEVTERAALDEIQNCQARVQALRKLGFRLAVDDLGAGYAGLTSFAQIEPEVVKFDMSLVRGIDTSSVKRRLVRSMTDLFIQMDIMVVAEGVENERERAALVALGCDVLQGYLFARPGPGFPQAHLP